MAREIVYFVLKGVELTVKILHRAWVFCKAGVYGHYFISYTHTKMRVSNYRVSYKYLKYFIIRCNKRNNRQIQMSYMLFRKQLYSHFDNGLGNVTLMVSCAMILVLKLPQIFVMICSIRLRSSLRKFLVKSRFLLSLLSQKATKTYFQNIHLDLGCQVQIGVGLCLNIKLQIKCGCRTC